MVKKTNLSLNEWISNDRIPKAKPSENARYMKWLLDINIKFGKYSSMLFFLIVGLGINDCRTMFVSVCKQRKLVQRVLIELKTKAVPEEYEKVFIKSARAFNERLAHIDKIIRENIHLTEYEPFFEAEGYDLLKSIKLRSMEQSAQYEEIKRASAEWNANHPDEVAKHMEEVREEIEIRDKHRMAIKERDAAEKAEKKAKEKAEREEIKEIKKNAHAHAVEKRRLERELQATMRYV